MPITLTDDMRAEMREQARTAIACEHGRLGMCGAWSPQSGLALLDERDRLERERDKARSDEALRAMEAMQAEAALAVERERVRELRAALEPFGRCFSSEAPDDQGIGLRLATERDKPLLRAADFRLAARLLASYSEDGA